MQVKLSDFKTHISKYVETLKDEDILLTRNGKVIARVTAEDANPKVEALMSMKGILKGSDTTLEEAREERLERQ